MGWELNRGGQEDFSLPGEKHKTDLNPTTVNMDDFCEFMGWWISEGHVLKEGMKNVIGISQSKEPHKSRIEVLLKRMGISYKYSHHQFIFSSRIWANYLRQFGNCRDKFVPKEIMEGANQLQLRLFFEAFIDGDGTRQRNNRCYGYTISEQLANDLCTLGVMLGYAPHMTKRQREKREGLSYIVAFNPRMARRIMTSNRIRKINKQHQRTQFHCVNYSGPVYCLGFEQNHYLLY